MDKRVPKNCVEPARARIPISGAHIILGKKANVTKVCGVGNNSLTKLLNGNTNK